MAINPGGGNAPAPGGYSAPTPGGIDLNDPRIRALVAGQAEATMDVTGTTGDESAITRSVTVRPGGSTVVSYAWTVASRPAGSSVGIDSGATTDTATTDELDEPGEYVLQCVVTFSDGTVFTLTTTHEAEFEVEEPPGDGED